MRPPRRFELTPHLSRRLWDGECVLYDDLSGDTHHLEPLTAAALLMFDERPLSIEELAERMADVLEVEGDEELLQWCQRSIFRFRLKNIVSEVEI